MFRKYRSKKRQEEYRGSDRVPALTNPPSTRMESLSLNEPAPHRYAYRTIAGSGLIRVLNLHKTRHNRLSCSIVHINLEEGGYQALSYEWGEPEQPFEILVHGTDEEHQEELGYIPLTKNLFKALKDLRDCPDIKSKRFWIDQICINQENEEEKGHQVELMAAIYRNASQVFTYLGPPSEDLECENGALRLLEDITTHFKPYFVDIARTMPKKAVENPKLSPLRIWEGDSTILEAYEPYWIHLLRIIYSGWTRRLWMIQENILCPKTHMLRGCRLLEWISVGSIPVLFYMDLLPGEFLLKLWSSVGLEIDPFQTNSALRGLWRNHINRNNADLDNPGVNMESLCYNIISFSQFRCKDPRDRVYAVLGISWDAELLGIVPDYQRPESQVFIDFSTRIYRHQFDLGLLNNIGVLDNLSNPSIPSWALGEGQHNEVFCTRSYPHPLSRVPIEFEAEDSIMVTRGRIVDKFEIVGSPVPFKWALDVDDRMLLLNMFTAIEHLGMSMTTVIKFFRAWVCDSSWPSCHNDVVVAYDWILYAIEHEKDLPKKLVEVLMSVYDMIEKEGLNGNFPDLDRLGLVQGQIGGRTFCISEQKRFCNATGKARPGDLVAVLAGGRMVYLLRPAGDNYQYVGTLWIEDLVDGALYKDVLPHDVDYEIRLV